MTSRRKKVLAAAAAAGAAAIVLLLWRPWGGGTAPALRFETARAERGRIVAKVTATGTLSALVTVQVGSQVSGRVQALYADFNSPVKKGQRIARIDPQLFEAAVEQARANHLAAQGNLTKARAQAVDARRQLERTRALAEKKLVAQADLDTAEANAQVAAAQVEAANGSVLQTRAALHQAEVNLAFTDIVSPTSGVVISRNVDVGQTVAASLQAPTLFVIAEDLAKMQVNTSVAEADVGRLRDGMEASFTVDAYPSEVFHGTVRQIRNAPQTVQNVVTYDAVVDVENPELKLRPGMTANVTFVYAEKDDVLKVPNAALRFRPPPEMLAQAVPSGGGTAGPGAGAAGAGQTGASRPAGAAAPSNAGAGAGPGAAPAAGNAARGGRAEPPDRRTLWLLRGGSPVQVRIRSGISDGSSTEVVEGEVEPGDAVVVDAVGPARGPAAAMRRGL
jgi:HlyD family secretion protein